MPKQPTHPRAFALQEALAITLILIPLACALIVMSERARRNAMASDDLANLRQIGQLTGQYAAEHKELLWTFSWKAGQSLSQWPELNSATTDAQAAANQAVDILRRRTGNSKLPPISNWFCHVLYSHLVLEDWLGSAVPDRKYIGTGDRYRLLWASDPAGFAAGKFLPYQPDPSGSSSWRWPYSTSFSMPMAFYSAESGSNAYSQHGNNYNLFSVGFGPMGAKPISNVAWPSQKVLVHESHGRHFGKRQPFFAVSSGEARVPLLLVDGAAEIRSTHSAKKGWNPRDPSSTDPTAFFYDPVAANAPWDPPAVSGNSSDSLFGHYRFTRMGTQGRDFGGPEIPYP